MRVSLNDDGFIVSSVKHGNKDSEGMKERKLGSFVRCLNLSQTHKTRIN